jgi:phosphocarrier protein
VNVSEDLSKEAVIVNDLGLHARSAARIAALARNAKSDVWLIRDGEKADAKSIIDMLTLACGKGTTVTIKIDSGSDAEVLHNIADLVECGFGE